MIVAATPAPGHAMPLVDIAAGLGQAGHRVTVLTGRRFRGRVEQAGLEFAALPAGVDFTDHDADTLFPARRDRSPGFDLMNFDLAHVFGDAIPAQHAAL